MMSKRTQVGAMLLAALIALVPAAHAKKPKPQAVFPAATIQAKVVRYLVNPFGEVDGLILDSGTLAKTPPHMSGDLVAFAKPGDVVTIQGVPEPGMSFKVYSVANAASNQTLVRREPAWNERPMPKHLRATGLKEMSAAGTIQHVITGKHGEPHGAVLDNGTIVRVGPKEAYPYYGLFRIGAPLAARGYGTENAYGRSLEATALGTNPGSLQPLYGQATGR